MLIKQISVFLENKPGKLAALTKILAENKIDLQALSIAETSDYGILRIIVDKPEELVRVLQVENYPCKTTEVLAVNVADEPGGLTHLLSVLAENNISLAYTYAFQSRDKGRALIVLRVDDNEKTAKILKESGVI